MLTFIRILHTIVWAIFAGAILVLPLLGWSGRFDWALGVIAAVTAEGVVLLLNRWRCPLTDMAAKYVDGEPDEAFDIYLPVWLARHNKLIFTTLFGAGTVFVLVCWLTRTA
ncbi:MAG: hypothetical protein AB7K09_24975 [Planctomycetota bacterium]